MIAKYIRGFFDGHERNIRAKKNIISSLLLKGLSIVFSLMVVPLMIGYLDKMQYGVWLTITSFISWFYFFDLGLGNGLRNKLAEAEAKGDKELALKYAATTIVTLIIISLALLLILNTASFFIDWAVIFNAPSYMRHDLGVSMQWILAFFSINFVLQVTNTLLNAKQKTGWVAFINFSGNLLSFVVIWFLKNYTHSSFIMATVAMSAAPLIGVFLVSVYFFGGEFRVYLKNIMKYDFKYLKEILNLGFKFFVITIANVVLFMTTNMLISQFFSPEEVTPYNIAYKYFSVLMMVLIIIIAPLWSAYTEANAKKEYDWIIKTHHKILNIWKLFMLVGLVMLAVSNVAYKLWVGNLVHIPFEMSLVVFLFVAAYTFGGCYVIILNGLSEVKLQLYSSIAAMVLFIPISFLFVKVFHWGVIGIVISSIFCNFNGFLVAPIQLRYIKKTWLKETRANAINEPANT